MGKRYFLLVIFITLGLGIFSGCQSTNEASQIKKMALNQDKRIGVIQSLGGAPVSSQATHLLRLNNGKTLFLKSPVIDLANIKYSGKEVEVGGNIIRTTDGNEVMSVQNIDLVDRDVTIAQDLPKWVDYDSNNLRIGLRYRDDYRLVENSDSLTFTKTEKQDSGDDAITTSTIEAGSTGFLEKKTATITVKIISKDSNYNLLEAMGVTSDSSADLLAKGYSKSKITQRALDAYKLSKPDRSEVNYFIKSGYSYQLKFMMGDSATLTADQNMFYDILASINFVVN